MHGTFRPALCFWVHLTMIIVATSELINDTAIPSTTEPMDPIGLHSHLNCDAGSCRNRCDDKNSSVSEATGDSDGEASCESDGDATWDSDVEAAKPPSSYGDIINQKEKCSCSKSCIIFGDCCFDYFSICLAANLTLLLSNVHTIEEADDMMQKVFDSNTSIREKVSMYLFKSCKPVHEKHGVSYYWMISDCPWKHNIDFTQDENELKCRSTLSDPLWTVPASLTRQPDIVYQNVYCALCNGIQRDELTLWKSTAECSEMESATEISYKEFLEKLETSECIVQSETPGGAHHCLQEHDEVLDSCSLLENKEQRFKTNSLYCRSYLYPLITDSGEKTRNWHCGSCSTQKSFHDTDATCNDIKKTFLFYNASMPVCPEMSCDGLCHKRKTPSSCQCDIECLLFGDCCFDFIPVCLGNAYEMSEVSANKTLITAFMNQRNITSILSHQEHTIGREILKVEENHLMMLYNKYRVCVSITGPEDQMHWVIGSCPDDSKDQQCNSVGNIINQSMVAPASHKMYPDVVFRNIYCGLCHGISSDNLIRWKTCIHCSEPVQSFNSERRSCSVEDANIFDISPETENLPLSKILCQAYRYPVFSDDGNLFRNLHCENTKGVIHSCPPANLQSNVENYTIKGIGTNRGSLPVGQIRGGLSILFNFNENGISFESGNGISIFQEISCQTDEVYDHYHHICKKLHCQQGKVAINGSCIRNGTWFAEERNMVYVNGTKEFILACYILTNKPFRKEHIDRLIGNVFMDKEIAKYLSLLKLDDLRITNVSHVPDFLSKNSFKYKDEDKHIKHLQITIKKTSSVLEHLDAFSMFVKRLFRTGENAENILDVSVQNFVAENGVTCSFGAVMELMNTSIDTVDWILYANDSDKLYPLDNVAFVCSLMRNNPHLRKVFVCDIPLNCDPVAYNLTDFVLEDGVLKSLHSDLVLSNDSYFVLGEEVLSCHNFTRSFHKNQSNLFFKFDHVQDILSYVTSGISLISLIMTLTVYILLPELQNLPGRLTMSLSASLILAQVLLLLIKQPAGVLCQTLAVSLHFLWLCSFMWMTAMSINLARTFTRKLKGSSMTSAAGTHARFTLFVVGFPLVIVTVSVVVDFLDTPGIDIGYGKHGMCWIANPRASLLVFGAPLALIILVNLIAFILTFYKIEKSMRSSKDISSTKGDRFRAIIYGKLFIIMGLSWGFSFTAAFANFAALWYIFILLNGLQGFYIFISFVCTDRVKKLLKKKISGPDEEESISTKRSTAISKI